MYAWFRVKSNGYTEKLHDRGTYLSAFVYSILFFIFFLLRSDKLDLTKAEFLDLTYDEVGDCVELVYTPVRADGLKGCPKTVVSSPVAPG